MLCGWIMEKGRRTLGLLCGEGSEFRGVGAVDNF